ncbi:MAG: hypothetical protein IH994_13585 [Proteobacteria bacterium]|nr:hypothetical protein [Pseudomonadota bacterium]
MAHENMVLKSIEIPNGGRCVDIFMRPDATFGFEEFRRDTEDARGWFPIGNHGARIFRTEEDAFNEALSKVPWLGDAGGDAGPSG